MKSYFIHDNGDKPFLVTISNDKKNVFIYKRKNDFDRPFEKSDYVILVKKYTPQKVWIGVSVKSEMTKFSKGYGAKYNGNTILLQITKKKYIFIGNYIGEFTTNIEIISYYSPIGNNDVPYPYAIDKENKYYLLGENIILQKSPKNKNPYYYYYDNNNLIYQKFEGIEEFYIDGNKYMLTYSPNTKHINKRIEIVKNGNKITLSKKMYKNLMKRFGKKWGFLLLKIKIIA